MEQTQEAIVAPVQKKKFKDIFFDATSPVFTPFESPKYIYTIGILGVWIVAFFGMWEMAPDLIPGPIAVFTRLFGFLTDANFYENIITSLWLTCKAMFISIIISCILAYLSVTAFFRPVARFLVRMRFMSLMGFIFTFILVFKGGAEVKLVMLIFGIVPFFTLSLLSVIDRIPQQEYDFWTTIGYSKWKQVWFIIMRNKADYTIEAIRANFAISWIMITLVESQSMSEGGIGVMLFRFNKYNQLIEIFALQIVIFAFGMLFDYALQSLRYGSFPHVKLAERR